MNDPDRGFHFGAELAATVHKYGPLDLSEAEREALSEYLLESAVEWVKARNRAARANAGTKQ